MSEKFRNTIIIQFYPEAKKKKNFLTINVTSNGLKLADVFFD